MSAEGFKDIYPKSGLYREYRDEVEDRADRVGRAVELAKVRDVEGMFGLSGDAYAALSEDERLDIWNFVYYGTKRLASSAIHSPLAQDWLRKEGVQKAFTELAPTQLATHDLVHAMISYARNRGSSMTPAYLQVPAKEEQFTDRTAIEEEMTVELIEFGGTDFVNKLLSGVDVLTMPPYDRPELLAAAAPLEYLKKEDPLTYALRIYEVYWRIIQTRHETGERRAKMEAAFDAISQNPDPEYIRIFTEKFEDAQSGHPDPKFGFKTFERIMQPLLERLRNNPDAE